jgi:penicillin-binding protein 1C
MLNKKSGLVAARFERKSKKRNLKVAATLCACALVFFFAVPPNKSRLYPKFSSFQICDRNGKLLREILSKDYKTSCWVNLDEMSSHIVVATILREDKRFYSHFGVDPIGLIRAAYDNIKNRRIVSGGSTITMQMAKTALNLKKRSILTKMVEMIYALKLELHLSKKEILEIYLNRTPYGNQNYGIEAAANFYFRKPARQLSLGEACILASIPKSPIKLNPYRNPDPVLQEKKKILKSLLAKQLIDSLDYCCAIKESLNIVPNSFNFEASHFVDYIINKIDMKKKNLPQRLITSIDLNLQNNFEQMLATTLKSLKSYNVNQGAVLVMDTKTGEILAMVGSKNYFDEEEGQVNGCLALRQPGSSIKPFLYALALESGIPASYVLPDTLLEFNLADGTKFAPRNYGDKYHGPTRAREALASSFNVPTVYLLEKIGVQRFHNRLKELNFTSLNQDASFYGLSLGLGAGEVSLLEMVNGYRTIAQEGVWKEERSILNYEPRINTNEHEKKSKDKNLICVYPRESAVSNSKQVFSREIAYIITNILSDNSGRIKSFGEDSPLNLPFPCASKTGTSKDFRDNWCIGFTRKYVVGVWVGNFDGSPMEGVAGISGAAPLFRDIMIELHRKEYPPQFEEPSSLVHQKVCAKSGKIATAFCTDVIEELFISGTEPKQSCDIHNPVGQPFRVARLKPCPTVGAQSSDLIADSDEKQFQILCPTDGDIYKIDPQVSYAAQGISFRAREDETINEVVFKLDGKILCRRKYSYEYLWKPIPGEHKLEVIGKGKTSPKIDQVSFRVF